MSEKTDEPKTSPSGGGVGVSQEELRAAFSGPAVHSNRMFLSMVGAGARIAFMEQLGDSVSPQFRAAVILHPQDAMALRDLLNRQLAPIEEEITKAIAAAKAEDGQSDGS